MPSRRAVIASGVLTALAGCIAPTAQPEPEELVPDEWHEEPKQGAADPIETKADIEDDVEYLPEKEAVRIDGGDVVPVDQWLTVECRYVALDVVADIIRGQFGNPDGIAGPFVSSSLKEDDVVIRIDRRILLSSEGGVRTTPDIEFEEIRSVMPRYVDAEVVLDDFSHVCRIPVYIMDAKIQEFH